MNKKVQLVCFWCCAPSHFVVQMNNFFSLVLVSAVILNRRGKQLISKTIKYKLDGYPKMHFAFFLSYFLSYFIHSKCFLDFVKDMEMNQIAVGGR